VARAVFAIRKGAVSLDTFIAELKAAKLIADTGLTPEELLIVKDAFTRARTLAADEKWVAELEKAASVSDLKRLNELIEGKITYWTDDLVGFRKEHILNRHRNGSGISGKTEFPATWSDERILYEINKIANNPNLTTYIGKWNSPYKIGIVDGIEIRVDFYPANHLKYSGKVSTAYPTNVNPNP
jgi:hypothetical protein